MPWINGLLMVGVLTLVLGFRSSERLAYAYGMAVTGTITITLLLFLYYARTRWGAPLWLVMIGGGILLLIDLLFVAANLTKLVHGAWLPLLIGIVAFTVMITWHRGRKIVTVAREEAEGPLDEFIDEIRDCQPPLARVPGTAVFLNRGKETAPLALRTCVEHTHVLHKHVVIVSIETLPMPRAPESERIQVDALWATSRTESSSSQRITATWRRRTCWTHFAASLRNSPKARSRSTTRPISCRSSNSSGAARQTMAQWRKRLFIARPTSPPTPPNGSACPATA